MDYNIFFKFIFSTLVLLVRCFYLFIQNWLTLYHNSLYTDLPSKKPIKNVCVAAFFVDILIPQDSFKLICGNIIYNSTMTYCKLIIIRSNYNYLLASATWSKLGHDFNNVKAHKTLLDKLYWINKVRFSLIKTKISS